MVSVRYKLLGFRVIGLLGWYLISHTHHLYYIYMFALMNQLTRVFGLLTWYQRSSLTLTLADLFPSLILTSATWRTSPTVVYVSRSTFPISKSIARPSRSLLWPRRSLRGSPGPRRPCRRRPWALPKPCEASPCLPTAPLKSLLPPDCPNWGRWGSRPLPYLHWLHMTPTPSSWWSFWIWSDCSA